MAELKLPRSWQDWHITKELGEGAYGRVYRAEKENGGDDDIPAEAAFMEERICLHGRL